MKELSSYAYILTQTIRVVYVGLTAEITACMEL